MARPRLNLTDDERRLRKLAANALWVSIPANKAKKYEADKKTQSVRHRRWRQANKHKTRLKSANERAVRLQRLPKWANRDEIKQFYLLCPEGMHVDHIIPLRGKTVSGLHVVSNLQYLPADENLRKGNSFEE